jgi:hypothetical protein
MNITGFSEPEKSALLDLLVLGMYADGHLAAVEDARIQRLLDAMSLTSDHAKQKAVDASVTKASRLGSSPASVRSAVAELAKAFSNPDARRLACSALDDLLASDNQVADREKEFLAFVREVFGI